jgi:hypothetical protein
MFLAFWRRKAHVFVASAAAVALCAARRSTWRYATPSLSMLILYLMSPVIFYVTRLRGVFFTDRHYLYYELAVPLLFLSAAFCLSEYLASHKLRQFVLPTTLLVSLVVVAAFSRTSFTFGETGLCKTRLWWRPAGSQEDLRAINPAGASKRVLFSRRRGVWCSGAEHADTVDRAPCTGEFIPVAKTADRP